MIIFWIIFVFALLLAASMTSGTIYVNSKNSLEPLFSSGPTGPTGPAGSGTGGGGSLATLSDVTLFGPTGGQSLVFSNSLSKWTNTQLAVPEAEVWYFGDGTTFTFITVTNTIYNLLGLSSGPSLIKTPSTSTIFDISSGNSIKWTGPRTEIFKVTVTLTASTDGPNDVYGISLFVDGTLLPNSQTNMNFIRSNAATTYSYNRLVPLNTNQSIDVRMQRTTVAPDKDVTMYFASLILTGSIPL